MEAEKKMTTAENLIKVPLPFFLSVSNSYDNISSYFRELNQTLDYKKIAELEKITKVFNIHKITVSVIRTLFAIILLLNDPKVTHKDDANHYVIELKNKNTLVNAAGYNRMSANGTVSRFSDRTKASLFATLKMLSSETATIPPFITVCKIKNEVIARYGPVIKVAENWAGITITVSKTLTYEFERMYKLIPSDLLKQIALKDGKKKLRASTLLLVFYLYTFHQSYGMPKTIKWVNLAEKIKLHSYLKNRNYKKIHTVLKEDFLIAKRLGLISWFKYDESKDGLIKFVLNDHILFPTTRKDEQKDTITEAK